MLGDDIFERSIHFRSVGTKAETRQENFLILCTCPSMYNDLSKCLTVFPDLVLRID